LPCCSSNSFASHVAPDPRRRGLFKLSGLVTRRVVDAFGRTEQEALLDFRPIEALVPPPIDRGSVRLRIVEVQMRARKAMRVTR
jgi:hypothetical protein